VEFLKNVREMYLHREHADIQLVANFLVGKPLGEPGENLSFPFAEEQVFVRRGQRFLKRRHHLAGDVAAHGRAALPNVTDGGENLLRRGTLEQIAAGPGPQCLEDRVGILIHCKRRLKSAAGGARKVLHLPGKEDCFFRVSSSC